MQMVGEMCKKGVTAERLLEIKKEQESMGTKCDYYDLTTLLDEGELKRMGVKELPAAGILVLRGGISELLGENDAWMKVEDELELCADDKYAKMYGEVRLKSARWNCLLAEFQQDPDYKNGRGSVYDIREKRFEYLNRLREQVTKLVDYPLGPDKLLQCGEVNHYYDCRFTGIGWHGDAERRIVVGSRHGPGSVDMPVKWCWMKSKLVKKKNGKYEKETEYYGRSGGSTWGATTSTSCRSMPSAEWKQCDKPSLFTLRLWPPQRILVRLRPYQLGVLAQSAMFARVRAPDPKSLF